VARFDARRRAALRRDAGIVRNRLKIDATVSNARAFLAVQREFGSFDRYMWSFVAGEPIVNRPRAAALPARTPLSDALSRDLTRRGFRFVGSTIVYAFLQAVGVVNDHSRDCFRCPPVIVECRRSLTPSLSASGSSGQTLVCNLQGKPFTESGFRSNWSRLLNAAVEGRARTAS
jgi:hypothetical protein